MKKLKIFDSSYFIGKSHFAEDGTQNYLVFQPMYRYFKQIAGVSIGNDIYYWHSKGLPNHSITPSLDYYGIKNRLKFNGSCLKQHSVTFKAAVS